MSNTVTSYGSQGRAPIGPAFLPGVKVHQVRGKVGGYLANLFVGSAVEEYDLGFISCGVPSGKQ